MLKLQDFEYNELILKDEELVNAFRLELEYLRSLKPEKLTAGFLERAGLDAEETRYGGWEVTEIQGHTLGHYLTALAQAYGATGESDLKDRIEQILAALERSQEANGYLFAWDEEIFDRVESGKPAWVPWYTMHKIVSGLISTYHFTKIKKAYTIAARLGDWIYNRCKNWTPELKRKVLAVEYGGMNDCLYELYMMIGDERYREAAEQFDETWLFEELYQGRDVLNGLHANTTIPKILGGVKRYVAVPGADPFYLKMGENFWDIVISHHTYITGGNSEWEHFGQPDILDGERTACNCETCNSYNMLKLSKLLFQITANPKYRNYYNHTAINSILSSQNPQTGMTTYFQPMATGYFKVFGTPYNSFWCCTGSGMENFTKLQEGILYRTADTWYLSRFADCDVHRKETGEQISVRTGGDEVYTVEIILKSDLTVKRLAVCLPDWLEGRALVTQNGHPRETTIENGFFILEEDWKQGDHINIQMPMNIQVKGLPDNPNVAAFRYGPYVLSAALGNEKMNTTYTGVEVLVPEKDLEIPDYIVLEETNISQWKKHINRYLRKKAGIPEFEFKQRENEEPLIFKPHYRNYEERYGIYWKVFAAGSAELEAELQKKEKRNTRSSIAVDLIPIGNDQYELAHGIKGEQTDIIRQDGHVCRYLKEDGWVSYIMKTESEKQVLCVTYWGSEEESQCSIFINGQFLAAENTEKQGGEAYLFKEYLLPEDLISGNSTVIVKFQNSSSNSICHLCDELFIRRA